jgi:hypothetical protein
MYQRCPECHDSIIYLKRIHPPYTTPVHPGSPQHATKSKDLYDQIEELIARGNLPGHISEALHAVRNIGNIAAHSLKSTTTGAIVDVEPGEADWNLETSLKCFLTAHANWRDQDRKQ